MDAPKNESTKGKVTNALHTTAEGKDPMKLAKNTLDRSPNPVRGWMRVIGGGREKVAAML